MTIAARVLHALEEAVVDGDVLDCPLLNSNPNSVFEKQIAQLVAVNQIDRRRAISNCFRLGIARECSRGYQNALLPSA